MTSDPIPPGLRMRLAGRRGYDTVCLPVGELRILLAEYDRVAAGQAALLAAIEPIAARIWSESHVSSRPGQCEALEGIARDLRDLHDLFPPADDLSATIRAALVAEAAEERAHEDWSLGKQILERHRWVMQAIGWATPTPDDETPTPTEEATDG